MATARTTGALTLALTLCAAAALHAQQQKQLRIAVEAPPAPSVQAAHALDGVRLGAEEAERTAALMGWTLTLVELAPGAAIPPGVHALLSGLDDAQCAALHARAVSLALPVLNIGCTADTLRGPECAPTLFHIAASDAMEVDATRALDREPSPVDPRALLWHPSLERFGAAQLNDRFRARYARDMDAAAWAGWFAVKVLWEAAARVRSDDPARLLEFLGSERGQFDGHKGVPLSFRAWDHQLRQPLYVVSSAAPAEVIAEVPGRTDGGTVRDALDALGVSAARSTCTATRG